MDFRLPPRQRPDMAESTVSPSSPGGYYEFFAGGGMVRAGLGETWRCLFANDFDPAKAAAYRANWGGAGLRVGDIADLTAADLEFLTASGAVREPNAAEALVAEATLTDPIG